MRDRHQSRVGSRGASALLLASSLLAIQTSFFTHAGEVGVVPQLDGIGYYEQILQSGVSGASYAGGTEIVFYGQGMSHTPTSISAIFSNPLKGVLEAGPPAKQDIAFSSHTDGGKLKYTTPSLMKLHSATLETFANEDVITYDLSLMDYDMMTQQLRTLKCYPMPANCKITYSRAFTPLLYYIAPQVVYEGSEVSFWIDPKSAQTKKSTTLPEYPFLEVRLNGYAVDFEPFLEEDVVLSANSKNNIRGYMGAITPSLDTEMNFKFRVGQALQLDQTMIRCSYDNQTCYKAKAVGVIRSISAQSGYTTGGQLITIKGRGFTSDNLDVKIDGVTCEVQSNNVDQLTCITGAQPVPSSGPNFLGQHGLRRKLYNSSSTLDINTLNRVTDFNESLHLDLEAPYNQKNGVLGNTFSGYFKAPVTGRYRFYLACDDNCQIYLSKTSMDPSKATLFYQQPGGVGYRSFFTWNNNRFSPWVNFDMDGYYFLEVRHTQFTGADHMSVAVEIEDPQGIPGHHHSMKEVQRLGFSQTTVRDTAQINITDPDSGTFTLSFKNPTTGATWTSKDISVKVGTWEMYLLINGFYGDTWGAGVSVRRDWYDVNGVLTSTQANAKVWVYTITVNRCISDYSTLSIGFSKKTNATITVTPPQKFEKSTLPLQGSFKIKCATTPEIINVNGEVETKWNYTADILVRATLATIRDKITEACPRYREKFDISDSGFYGYSDDGRDLMIRFLYMNEDIPQMEIMSSDTSPVVGVDVFFNSTTNVPYSSQNLFYEPVPFDFLYTNETSPQVIVNVDGVEVVCESLNCGYSYVVPTASISGFSLTGSELTISGVSLPAVIRKITVGSVQCVNIVISSAGDSITCQVTPVAGSWTPVVFDSNGIIPIDQACTDLIEVVLEVSSMTPSEDLNPYGGTLLTISGAFFPQSLLSKDTLSVYFSDGTLCPVKESTSTFITCLPDRFQHGTTTATLNIEVNGISNSQLEVTVSVGPASVTALTPNSISPVLKKLLSLTVTGFAHTLDKNDLEVWAVDQKDATNIIHINVVETGIDENDATMQYIKVKFGGCVSGVYDIFVKSDEFGYFDTTGITMTAIGIVTDFSPKRGSVHGGTLITIQGYHFSDDYTDNQVRIGWVDCMVEKSTPFELQCRTMAAMEEVDSDEDLIVFLKTFEEAQCTAEPCTFSWVKTGLPVLDSYLAEYDESLGDFVLTLDGRDFGATIENTQILIDEAQQTILEASDTQIKVLISGLLSHVTSNIKLYLPIGIPEGMEAIAYTDGITLNPIFKSLTPNVGSPAGSLITAVVKGLGPNSKNVTLVNQAGVDICATVKIVSYGQVQCKTKVMTQADEAIRVKVLTDFYDCLGLNGECNYQTSDLMPIVTAVAKQADHISLILSGTGFLTSTDFTATFVVGGISADSVTVDSDTQMTVIYNYGYPLIVTVQSFVVTFVSAAYGTHWAKVSATYQNLRTVTEIASAVDCSYAGGCKLTVAQPGLLSSLYSYNDTTKNSLRVCGKVCKPILSESNFEQVTCTLPALPTIYSIDNFKIVSETYLTGTYFSSNSLLTASVFDGSNQNGWTSQSSNCHFGIAFRAGYIGVVNEVKYFMNRFTKGNYVGKLKFQGSMDGIATTYTDIFVVDQEIHEGWNYFNLDQGKELKYRFYRFFGTSGGSCVVGEASFRGYEVIDSNAFENVCQAQLYLNTTLTNLTGTVTYKAELTPLLKSISPRFGSVVGGEEVIFTGENFSDDQSLYKILIDNRLCEVSSVSYTEVRCITGKRPGLYEKSTLEIQIAGMGSVATQDLVFRYVNYWSEPLTWGGEFAPLVDDMVFVPKGLNLLVDVDSTPILSAVIVEGALIFPSNPDPEHVRTFDAHYVLVRGGTFEVGTEQFPYSSKLVITMHSSRESPELPIFGNKVIAMYNGLLDLHGIPRVPTWTELDVTSNIGSSTITLIRSVDWKVGERIVIAPTGYYNTEAEERQILKIDNTDPNKPVITLDSPLEFKHYAGVQFFGEEFIEMRAEVGLLTRNILYRGDPETSAKNEYGAHIMVHSNGMETLTARIEYIEFFNVGQAFQLGRYPIHFHLIGVVHNSYIKGNAIHQSYNRACTIHGVHYLRVTHNVAYNTKGHTFFIEDAAETHNLIEYNLAILTKKSWSLLNSDQTPASFWITHPDNIIRHNHAAGSDNYGYWFDTKPNPTGPSFDPNICPENSPLGEFANNVAHSNGRYGLRVFHKLKSRQFPCLPIIEDLKNLTDPYWQNPLITATFINFTSFKNKRNGAIALDVGDVRFVNFKVSDNFLAGIEFELTNSVKEGYAQINNALVIGWSANADLETNKTDSHGIIGPRTENFQIHNVRFYNFNNGYKAALGSCSHCFSPPSTDSGARTVTFSGLYFDKSVTIKIRYETPFRDIFFDLDGTLTGLGPNTWATPYWKHNHQPECQHKQFEYDGLICNSSIEIRRIVFYRYSPDIFSLMELKILPYDDNIVGGMSNETLKAYVGNSDNYGIVPFRPKAEPLQAWAMPYVTGRKYKLHWQHGLDFMQFQVDLSPKWKTTDQDVYFIFNFTDIRAGMDFLTGGDNIKNETILPTSNALKQTGANVLYNRTEVRQIHLLLNGKNKTRNSLVMKAYRCIGPCLTAIASVPIETTERLWSLNASWPSGKVPKAGEDIVIEPGKNFVYDLEESPIYNYIQINGRVTFRESAPKLHLKAKIIFIRSGELIIGNLTHPFLGEAQITLFGEKENQHIVYDNDIEAGNKILANTGLMQMYGVPRIARTRLMKTALQNDTSVTVEAGLSWKINDTIAFAPTRIVYTESEYAVITSYDNVTGVATLDKPMQFWHYGAAVHPGSKYGGIDIRGEVTLLNRNIRIQGNETDAWGCQIVTSDFKDTNETRIGRTIMDNIEIFNCSQYDTYKAAFRFQRSGLGQSIVSNSAMHHGLGIGIEFLNAANVHFVNNTVFDFVRYGINVDTSSNITIENNWVMGIFSRHLPTQTLGDPVGGIMGCANKGIGDKCPNITIINNIVMGVENADGVDAAAFSVQGHECGIPASKILFKNNIAHSIDGYGAIIFKNSQDQTQDQCIQGSFFTAYKCTLPGIIMFQVTDKVVLSDMLLVDNNVGAVAMGGQEGDELWSIIKNSRFYGDIEEIRDCDKKNVCGDENLTESEPGCRPRSAIMLSSFAQSPKPALIRSKSSWPQFKIKADACWGGNTQYENLTFVNYKQSLNWCGSSQVLFKVNGYAPDYTPRAKIIGSTFENVDESTMAYLFTPPNIWAVIDDCGQFPCTGPNNILMQFEKSIFKGLITPRRTAPTFQIISGNDENSAAFSNCVRQNDWNAYYCLNENLAIVLFESLDDDKMTRLASPITITGLNITSRNVLNSFMDHLWDGFYTSMKRLSRWPTLIQGGKQMFYNINYQGTPPQKQRFTLKSDLPSVVLQIRYSKPGAYVIKNGNGTLIKENDWDKTISAPGLIKGDLGGYCGENRYVGIVNILEFYLTKNCILNVELTDSIMTSVRLNWTMDNFYSSGGSTQFQDRVAASLGIKAQNIKIVSIYQGSVVIDFNVVEDETKSLTKQGGLDVIQKDLTKQLTSNSIKLGAPILSVKVVSFKAVNQIAQDASQVTVPTVTVPSSLIPTTTTTKPTVTIIPDTNYTAPVIKPRTPSAAPQVITNLTYTVETQEHAGGNQTLMVAVICSILAVILFGGALGYFLYKKYQANQLTLKNQAEEDKKQVKQTQEQASPDQMMMQEELDEQYHPGKNYVDIFGRGDPFKKANEADNVEEEEDIDDDEETEQQLHAQLDSNVFHTQERISQMHEERPMDDSSWNTPVTQQQLKVKVTPRKHTDEELGSNVNSQRMHSFAE